MSQGPENPSPPTPNEPSGPTKGKPSTTPFYETSQPASPPPDPSSASAASPDASPGIADGAGSVPQSAGGAAVGRVGGQVGSPAGRLRGAIPLWLAALCALACVLAVLSLWTLATRGKGEDRWISPASLPSPRETSQVLLERTSAGDGTAATQPMDVRLIRATFRSLRRVVAGFALAVLVGVPVGVLCGCFTTANAFFRPLTEFGRNAPMAALVALTFALYGIGEWQKIMFIFMATVAFVTIDAAQAVRDVPQSLVDTAFTLGANRWQIVTKVLVPQAMPSVFNSLRLLFGLAFGYITLAEAVGGGGDDAGLGGLILAFQRRGPREGIYLILILIPFVAFGIDRLLYWTQVQLFPHRLGGPGLLAGGLRWIFRQVEAGWRWIVPAHEFHSVLPPRNPPAASSPLADEPSPSQPS